jgi:hypothetical protein
MVSPKGTAMVRALACFVAFIAAAVAWPAHAEFHLFRIDQVFSNAGGSVQYVVMRESTGSNGESFWAGIRLETTSASGTKQQFVFPANLPSTSTASRSVLIATSGFAALGLVTPDYIVPNGFIPVGGGKLDYASGIDEITFAALPADGGTAIDRNGTQVPATPKNFAGDSATLTASTPPSLDLDQHGLTGSWFEPATSGQGLEVEFFPDFVAPGTALVAGAWFTFDVAPAGGVDRQRWYTFGGNGVRGAANVPVTIFRNVDGNFDAPPMTNPTVVGSGTLGFTDCMNGTFAYQLDDGRTGTIPITRITPNVTCVAQGASPTNPDFALSGNWYDPATSGQGFVVEANPLVPVLFFTWYTYAPSGQGSGVAGQRWFTGQAPYTPGSRTIAATLLETTGGVFDQPTNPAQSTGVVGTSTLTFASCTSAQLQFNFTSGSMAGRSGTIALTRLGPVPPGCVATTSAATDPPMDALPPMDPPPPLDPPPPMSPPSTGYPPYGP